jgi:Zn-dependent protease with chaperone function
MAESRQAVCFLSNQPGSQPCRLTLDTGGLLIEPAAGPAVRWPYPDLNCEVGGEDHDWLMVSCPAAASTVAQVAVRDPDTIAALAACSSGPTRELLACFADHHQRHARRSMVALAVGGLVVVGLFLGGWLLLTRLAPTIVAASLPPAGEKILGELAVAQLLAGEETIAAGPAATAVQTITDRLVAAIQDNPGYEFEVTLVASDEVNAVAFPGGQIVVYSGLLAEAGSADEVAGVLAHEISHVLHRDGLRQLISRLGGAALVRLALGGGDVAGLIGQLGELDQLAYSRGQEQAADTAGLQLLVAAGLPPAALPAFFTRMQRLEAAGLPGFLSTHPDTAARIAALREQIVQLPAIPAEPLAIDWNAVEASLP